MWIRLTSALAALLVAAGLLALPAAAHGPRGSDHRHGHEHGRGYDHDHHGRDHGAPRNLTVMTQNLYLGSSLGPALEAETPEEFVEAVARIYATVQYTNFPARAQTIAAEIQAREPDLIGLQEVSKWTTEGLNPPPGYDFLAILEADLAGLGLHYEVASVSHNAHIGPAPLVGSGGSCPVLEGPQFTCGGRSKTAT